MILPDMMLTYMATLIQALLLPILGKRDWHTLIFTKWLILPQHEEHWSMLWKDGKVQNHYLYISFKKQKAPRPVLANDTNYTVQVYLAMGKEVLAET